MITEYRLPWMSRVSPSRSLAAMKTTLQTVQVTSGKPAASIRETPFGMGRSCKPKNGKCSKLQTRRWTSKRGFRFVGHSSKWLSEKGLRLVANKFQARTWRCSLGLGEAAEQEMEVQVVLQTAKTDLFLQVTVEEVTLYINFWVPNRIWGMRLHLH